MRDSESAADAILGGYDAAGSGKHGTASLVDGLGASPNDDTATAEESAVGEAVRYS